MLPSERPEAPGSWDELATKLDRKFGILQDRLETMRVELEAAAQHADALATGILKEARSHE